MKTRIKNFFPSRTFSSPFLTSVFPLFLTSLTLLFATAAQAQVPSYVPTNGLVGYWPFNGNANDESGNGNNGTVNGATLTADRFGIANSAYSFDGVDDYIQNQQSGVSGNTSTTVSFWIKSNSNNSGHVFSYGGNGISGGDCRVLINAYGSCSNSVGFDIYNSGIAYGTSFQESWDFYAVSYNSSISIGLSAVSIYKNGILLNTNCFNSDNGAPTFMNDFPITFGKYHSTIPTDYLNAIIDEIGFWNRALTADEVLSLYNGCNVAPLAVSGNITPTQFTQETYTYPITAGSTYIWTVTNGVIVSGQGTNTVNILWASTGLGNISVVETTAEGCVGTTLSQDVVVIPTNVEELANQLILYPNPVTTSLTLQVKSEMIGSDFVVFDALCKVVLRDKILSSNQNISVINLSNGNYILRVGEMSKVFTISK